VQDDVLAEGEGGAALMSGQLIAAELVYRSDNGEPMTDSLIVAVRFGYEHKNVLRKIDQLDCTDEFGRLNFEPTSYVDSQGKQQRMFRMTEKGFLFLASRFVGPAAGAWMEKFIEAFQGLRQMAVTGAIQLTDLISALQLEHQNRVEAEGRIKQDVFGLERRVEHTEQVVEVKLADIDGRLAKLESRKRREATPKTREAHIRCLQWLGWLCPLTGEKITEDEVEIDHFHTNQHPDLKHTWPLSKRGHLLLTTGKISRDDAYRAFMAYQHHLDQWQRLQRDNFVLVAQR
jgi:Rha family phage regulatory protein